MDAPPRPGLGRPPHPVGAPQPQAQSQPPRAMPSYTAYPGPSRSPNVAEGGHQQATQWYPPPANAEPAYDYDAAEGASPTQDDPANDDPSPEGRDAKRRRIARACDMCRKKKIKCDGTQKCSHCLNYKTECIFTMVEKKRAPPKGAKYIEGLENRLGRMENLLRLSGLIGEDGGEKGEDLGTLERRLLVERQGASGSPAQAVSQGQDGVSRAGAPQERPSSTSANGTPQEDPQPVTSPPVVNSLSGGPATRRSTDSPRSATAAGTNTAPSTQRQPPLPQKDPFKRTPQEVDALADQMCSLITNNCGETRYIGSSSGFSIFSPKGIQWVNEKTGDASFQSMIANATTDSTSQPGGAGWDHWKPEVFNDLFERKVFKPLPPRRECEALLRDYFEHFNQMFPLFHEPTFMHLVDKHYSLEPYEGSGWWASLNVALAIAHRLRVMSNVVDQEEDDHAWGYLKNAMAVMTELTMRNTDLLSVQALLGMALFLQGTPNPQPSFFLVAAAIRLAHSIGLHKRGSGFNLNAVESEQRKRVFWIAYLLDKDICLRSGRPPSQDDDDMNVELPSEDPPDNVGNVPLASPTGPNTNGHDNSNDGSAAPRPRQQADDSKEEGGQRKAMNLFRLMCTFAQIQSRVYKHLYSVRASRQSDGELLNTIGALDSELEAWKDSIPLDFRPEHPINAAHTPLILHVVCLHFAYYNCLTTIHRMSVHHGYWTNRLSEYAVSGLNARPLNPRVFMSAALCVYAARTSIGLVRYIPQGDYACVWLVLYYPVSALVTLFANILQNPQDARARSDLKLMSSVVSFLTMLERDVNEANGNVRRMLSVCAEFERIARVVLDKAERDLRSGRGKRKVAGSGLTERERQKELRDRGEVEKAIAEGLEEGKTLEQMQVETQAAYRRPVQTPSLRASVAGSSVHGGSSGASPASWGESQYSGGGGGGGGEYGRSPVPRQTVVGMPGDGTAFPQQYAQQRQHQHQHQQQSKMSNAGPQQDDPHFPYIIGLTNGRNHDFISNPRSPAPPPANFSQPQAALTDGYNNPSVTGFSPSNPQTLGDPLMLGDMGDMGGGGGGLGANGNINVNGDGGAGGGFLGGLGGAAGAGSFQQPFVPQDLWQMPMTLEWDWAEGLGLGSFTPGSMFEGGGGGGYMGT
ncbi:hypothetical protein LTR59_006100 [Friedmanniomyces endolithicus]|nr:hypothetical protein LTR94_006910 [Friedmanniomyces endolithicus]KAK0799462.1 hypothetical protein LTR59_006100 [Friedmanniomyces endolithicus]KAK0809548.1 hypothetical protein LTR38_004243 [Friedmanniomyces endolithicus]